MITETRRRQRGIDVGEEEATYRRGRRREREIWRTRKEQMMIRDERGRSEKRKRVGQREKQEGTVERRSEIEEKSGEEEKKKDAGLRDFIGKENDCGANQRQMN